MVALSTHNSGLPHEHTWTHKCTLVQPKIWARRHLHLTARSYAPKRFSNGRLPKETGVGNLLSSYSLICSSLIFSATGVGNYMALKSTVPIINQELIHTDLFISPNFNALTNYGIGVTWLFILFHVCICLCEHIGLFAFTNPQLRCWSLQFLCKTKSIQVKVSWCTTDSETRYRYV